MKPILFFVLTLLSTIAHAGTFGLHIGSHHFPNEGFNNFNPGAYYKHDSGATVGLYRNSFNKLSAYAGYTLEYGPAALTVGGITGYRGKTKAPAVGDVALMLVPSIKLPITVGGMSPRVAYIPKAEKNGAHVLHLMIEF